MEDERSNNVDTNVYRSEATLEYSNSTMKRTRVIIIHNRQQADHMELDKKQYYLSMNFCAGRAEVGASVVVSSFSSCFFALKRLRRAFGFAVALLTARTKPFQPNILLSHQSNQSESLGALQSM